MILSFQQFNGTTVLESTHIRKCAKCRRLIGRKAKGYSYGYRKREDVCRRCHRRNFRKYERAAGRQPGREMGQ